MFMHSYDPSQASGLPHDPIAAILGPRPIGWISTLGSAGNTNLAPYSFFTVVNYRPPLVAFSSVGYKDTVRNAERTREFVYNLATRELAGKVNMTSAEVDPEVDEFELAGLTRRFSHSVAAPGVMESPVSLECVVTDVRRLRDRNAAELDTWMVQGQVVMVHISSALLREGCYETALAAPILRGGGQGDYFEVTETSRFQIRRPR